MFYESLMLVVLSNPCVTRDTSSLMISESLGLFGLSNPMVTPDSSSLMISESLRAVWAVEFMCHLLDRFLCSACFNSQVHECAM